jgi:hypothetical protein
MPFNNKTISIALIIALVFIISCKKKDTEAPVITLNGDALITVSLNGSFTDPGATAYDTQDGALSVTVSGSVNTNFEGDYELSYVASDAAGNSTQATRLVRVLNDSRSYNGSYKTRDIILADTALYHSIFTTSTTINNRIWIQGFGPDSNEIVFGDISSNIFVIPKQAASNTGTLHYYWGTGTISTADSVLITVSFSDSSSGVVNNGVINYSRP